MRQINVFVESLGIFYQCKVGEWRGMLTLEWGQEHAEVSGFLQLDERASHSILDLSYQPLDW